METFELKVGEYTFSARADGPADGELVLLLHGFPETSYEWRKQLPVLAAAGYRAVAPDQRGYASGRSSRERRRLQDRRARVGRGRVRRRARRRPLPPRRPRLGRRGRVVRRRQIRRPPPHAHGRVDSTPHAVRELDRGGRAAREVGVHAHVPRSERRATVPRQRRGHAARPVRGERAARRGRGGRVRPRVPRNPVRSPAGSTGTAPTTSAPRSGRSPCPRCTCGPRTTSRSAGKRRRRPARSAKARTASRSSTASATGCPRRRPISSTPCCYRTFRAIEQPADPPVLRGAC